jgi:hypothetical protein
MMIDDLYVCDKRQVILKESRYWCLAEDPGKCPFAYLRADSQFECIHPEHLNFFKNKPSANP